MKTLNDNEVSSSSTPNKIEVNRILDHVFQETLSQFSLYIKFIITYIIV